MMKCQVVAYLIVFVASGLCISEPKGTETTGNKKNGVRAELIKKLTKANNMFATNLYGVLPQEKNAFISPLTMSTVLSMVYLGAKGATAEEMRRGLQYDSVGFAGDGDNVHEAFRKLHEYLNNDVNYTLDFLNTVLIQNDFKLLEDYRKKLSHFYSSDMEEVNFVSDGKKIMEHVNELVANATKEKIPKFLQEPLDVDTRLFLISAIYFKGMWKTMFDKDYTREEEFFNGGEIPVNVSMMNLPNVRLPYMRDEEVGLSAIELLYKNKEASMVIILPRDRKGLPEIEKSLSYSVIENILSRMKTIPLEVYLPKFRIEAEYELPEQLKMLGMSSMFVPFVADLSGMNGGNGLYVSKVLHKTVIDVNEEGSEAAAVSGVSVGSRIGSPRLIIFAADHPFMFFIRDCKTGVILFMGRVSQI